MFRYRRKCRLHQGCCVAFFFVFTHGLLWFSLIFLRIHILRTQIFYLPQGKETFSQRRRLIANLERLITQEYYSCVCLQSFLIFLFVTNLMLTRDLGVLMRIEDSPIQVAWRPSYGFSILASKAIAKGEVFLLPSFLSSHYLSLLRRCIVAYSTAFRDLFDVCIRFIPKFAPFSIVQKNDFLNESIFC